MHEMLNCTYKKGYKFGETCSYAWNVTFLNLIKQGVCRILLNPELDELWINKKNVLF